MPKFRLPHALAALALVSAAPAMADVSSSGPLGFVSRHEVVVEASPKAVWLALISPATWWTSDHTWSGDADNLTLTPQAGGCFCEKIPEVDEPGSFTLEGSVEHMRVLQAYPERALRMQGALGPLQSEPVTGVLTIAISKVEGGTRIVWEYNVGGAMRYEVPVIARAVDAVMGIQVAALAKPLGVVAMPEPEALAPEEPAGEDAPAEGKAEPMAAPATEPKPVMKPAPKPVAAPLAAPAKAPAVSPVSGPAMAPAAKAAAPAAPIAGAKPAMAPATGPAVKSAPAPAPLPVAKPALAPAPKPVATPRTDPALDATAAPATAPKPAPKPASKVPSVDDAFGDLEDAPPR